MDPLCKQLQHSYISTSGLSLFHWRSEASISMVALEKITKTKKSQLFISFPFSWVNNLKSVESEKPNTFICDLILEYETPHVSLVHNLQHVCHVILAVTLCSSS
jgi:hypothetical protein